MIVLGRQHIYYKPETDQLYIAIRFDGEFTNTIITLLANQDVYTNESTLGFHYVGEL